MWPTIEPTDRAAVMFTSGTTGRPKGVEITQANYAFAGTTMASAAQLGADDRQIVVLPLFHANAQYYSFASAIAVGASVALMHTFSASGFIPQAARHRATHASLFAGPIR
ncbi:MAG: AMP-binding protein [Ilumatobacteraceae bacterium]